ncbi:MAG: DUF3576 domain-containing protein [Rickettsiales bacterium]|nr:DUF3576 domain-containing protein [Rickettsiales bacterium]
MKKIYLIILLGLLACKTNNPNIVANFPEDPELKRLGRNGKMFTDEQGIIVFQDKTTEKTTVEDNQSEKFQITLWAKSFKTISQMLPISMADQKSGLILTDWGNINNDNNLYKINIMITGNKIISKNITLTVFKKLNNQKSIEDKEVKKAILNMILNTK